MINKIFGGVFAALAAINLHANQDLAFFLGLIAIIVAMPEEKIEKEEKKEIGKEQKSERETGK